MKNIIFGVFLFLVIIFLSLPANLILAQDNNSKYVIVFHGGAGFISPDIDADKKEAHFKSLTEALTIGKNILENGGASLDAVESVVRYFEDDSLFNAGRGAVFTSEGMNELDASIMDGKDLSSGAVTGVTIIKNPISLARLVMEKTNHVLFAGDGADNLGKKFGVEIVDPSYFRVESKYKRLLNKLKADDKGTVGCVALDMYGNIAAATSTGGLTGKMPGRVGDTPLINAGTYANNNTCGVSGTGVGELFIKNTIAYQISALLEFKEYTLKQAVHKILFEILPQDTGGVIAVDKDGNYVMEFNTTSMSRGVATSEGIFEVKIWK